MRSKLQLASRFDQATLRQQVRGAVALLVTALVPNVAFAAATSVDDVLDVLFSIVEAIIPLLVSCAVIVFFWGLVKFIAHADDTKAVEEGKQLIIWGLVGLFVIVALWSIVGYIQQSLGLDFAGLGGTTSPSLPTTIP